jgi:hypothetical protein
MNQLMATLAVGFVLSVGLMWTVEQDSLKGRPHHQTSASQVEKTISDAHNKPQPNRI